MKFFEWVLQNETLCVIIKSYKRIRITYKRKGVADLTFNIPALLTATAGTATDASSQTTALLMQMGSLVLLLVFFYFIFIRPQRKKDKETQEMRKSLQVGDEIVTVGGIVGIVVSKKDDTILLETGGNKNRMRIKVWAIQDNLTIHDNVKSEEPKDKKPKEIKQAKEKQ